MKPEFLVTNLRSLSFGAPSTKRNIAANADAKSKSASEPKTSPGEELKTISPQPGSKPDDAP